MVVALGKVALPGVLIVAVVVKELVVVVVLGVLVVLVLPSSYLLSLLPLAYWLLSLSLAYLLLSFPLAFLSSMSLVRGLLLLLANMGMSLSSLPLARSSSSPLSSTAYLLLSLAMPPSYWRALMDHGSCLYFVSFNLLPTTKKQAPPIHLS